VPLARVRRRDVAQQAAHAQTRNTRRSSTCPAVHSRAIIHTVPINSWLYPAVRTTHCMRPILHLRSSARTKPHTHRHATTTLPTHVDAAVHLSSSATSVALSSDSSATALLSSSESNPTASARALSVFFMPDATRAARVGTDSTANCSNARVVCSQTALSASFEERKPTT
jgi:hypothetical protein